MNAQSRDLWAGLLFAGLGFAFTVYSHSYKIGTALAMGPGYLPNRLGILLAFIGIAVIARSFWTDGRVDGLSLCAATPVLGAMLLFGYALEQAGLLAATAATVTTASLSGALRGRELALLILASGALMTTIVHLLALPIPILPHIR